MRGVRGLLSLGFEKLMSYATSRQAFWLVQRLDFSANDIGNSKELMRRNAGPMDISSINWFLPNFKNVFAGGIRTVLLFAQDLLRRKHVDSNIVIVGDAVVDDVKSRLRSAFPDLSDRVCKAQGISDLQGLPYADAAVCTLWSTAYSLLKFSKTRRKFYLIQDYEPWFYPAGSVSALVEATYDFGFYGLVNSASLKEMYKQDHAGQVHFFLPCVDTDIFRPAHGPKAPRPFTLFFYARPDVPRNCFQLGVEALRSFKKWGGDRVRVLTAGANWNPANFGLKGVVEQLGMLDYAETARIYETCDAGLVLLTTWSPSYVQLELMASGCLLVSNRNSHLAWLLRDEENCLLADSSASSIFDTLGKAYAQTDLRNEIVKRALTMIQRSHSDWTREIECIFNYMCDPHN
jgi:glycosyltransferase involved in cell wall biosynthesis